MDIPAYSQSKRSEMWKQKCGVQNRRHRYRYRYSYGYTRTQAKRMRTGRLSGVRINSHTQSLTHTNKQALTHTQTDNQRNERGSAFAFVFVFVFVLGLPMNEKLIVVWVCRCGWLGRPVERTIQGGKRKTFYSVVVAVVVADVAAVDRRLFIALVVGLMLMLCIYVEFIDLFWLPFMCSASNTYKRII